MQIYLKTQLERLQDFERAELPAFSNHIPQLSSQPKAPAPQERETSHVPNSEEDKSFFDEPGVGTPQSDQSDGQLFDDIVDEL